MMSFASYPFVMRSVLGALYYDKSVITDEMVQELCLIFRTPNSRSAMYWMPRALNWDFAIPDSHRIQDVSAPTLILWGRQDSIVDVRTALRFEKDIQNSRAVIIDGAGHMVHEEKPDEVNRAILEFTDRLKSPNRIQSLD